MREIAEHHIWSIALDSSISSVHRCCASAPVVPPPPFRNDHHRNRHFGSSAIKIYSQSAFAIVDVYLAFSFAVFIVPPNAATTPNRLIIIIGRVTLKKKVLHNDSNAFKDRVCFAWCASRSEEGSYSFNGTILKIVFSLLILKLLNAVTECRLIASNFLNLKHLCLNSEYLTLFK